MSRLTTDLTDDKAWIVGLLEPVVLTLLIMGIFVLIAALL
jgi:hypothetical protein